MSSPRLKLQPVSEFHVFIDESAPGKASPDWMAVAGAVWCAGDIDTAAREVKGALEWAIAQGGLHTTQRHWRQLHATELFRGEHKAQAQGDADLTVLQSCIKALFLLRDANVLDFCFTAYPSPDLHIFACMDVATFSAERARERLGEVQFRNAVVNCEYVRSVNTGPFHADLFTLLERSWSAMGGKAGRHVHFLPGGSNPLIQAADILSWWRLKLFNRRFTQVFDAHRNSYLRQLMDLATRDLDLAMLATEFRALHYKKTPGASDDDVLSRRRDTYLLTESHADDIEHHGERLRNFPLKTGDDKVERKIADFRRAALASPRFWDTHGAWALDLWKAMIDEQRYYRRAEQFGECLFGLQGQAFNSDLDSEDAQRRELTRGLLMRSVALGLLLENHIGRRLIGDARVADANRVLKLSRGSPGLIEDIALLSNVHVVRLHDEFKFAEATAVLASTIALLEAELAQTAVPSARAVRFIWDGDDHRRKGRFYGALFGTHAQSLAFSAHQHLLRGETTELVAITRRALATSNTAQSYFSDAADVNRQATYQVHMLIQQYIGRRRWGEDDPDVAAQARELVEGDPGHEFAEFIKEMRNERTTGRTFQVAVRLKVAWATGTPFVGLDRLIAEFERWCQDPQKLPNNHPWQQILGYVALLDGSAARRARWKSLLRYIPWSGESVAAIAGFFAAQQDHEAGEHWIAHDLLAWAVRDSELRADIFRDISEWAPLLLLPFSFS